LGVTDPPRRIDPYRPLFLVGVGYAVTGALVWLLAALRLIAYPGFLHRTLMIEGFEQSFIAGFLLTALGGLTHGGRSTTLEMVLAATAQIGVGVAALLGNATLTHACFLISMLVLFVAAAFRSRRGQSRGNPPRELIFIVTALILGIAGAIVLIAGTRSSDGARMALGLRLLAQGEVLTLVVGVGSILVPTFLGHRTQNLVPNVARPGWRGRSGFYGVVALCLVGSFALEAYGLAWIAAVVRAAGVSAVLLGVWKIHLGASSSRLALVLRAAGFAIMAGLWIGAIVPARPLLGEHLVFIGGYGLLTMGIATRVIVSHGGWPQPDETRLLHPLVLFALAIALVLRLAAELAPAHASGLWAASGTLWITAWLSWASGAVSRIVVLNRGGRVAVPQ
jgi:uncharacterized protein involved in response to NO